VTEFRRNGATEDEVRRSLPSELCLGAAERDLLKKSSDSAALRQVHIPDVSGTASQSTPVVDDHDGVSRWALGYALYGASNHLNVMKGKLTHKVESDVNSDMKEIQESMRHISDAKLKAEHSLNRRIADDEVSVQSTVDTDKRSFGDFDHLSPASPREFRSPSITSSTKKRAPFLDCPRDELVEVLFWKLDYEGSKGGRLGSPEMRRFATMCGFIGNDARWESEFAALRDHHRWGPVGLDISEFARYVDAEDSSGYCTTPELQCMCKGMRYVRGQTALFEILDADRDGFISKEELREGVQKGVVRRGYKYVYKDSAKE